jgi:hypothetical protein
MPEAVLLDREERCDALLLKVSYSALRNLGKLAELAINLGLRWLSTATAILASRFAMVFLFTLV